MTDPLPVSMPLRVADLPARKPKRFDLRPAPEMLPLIAGLVGAESVRKLSFKGEIRPTGKHDFVLEGDLGATVVQPCVVTLAPVSTRIEEHVTRRYLTEMPDPVAGDETGPDGVPMPDDDSAEPLPEVIDPGAVLLEALALAMPLYPRAEDAALDQVDFAPPGAAPLTADALKPFAGLAALREKLENGGNGGDDGGDDGGSGGGTAA
ncbi:hypothetical protein U879_13065 [Defluviimonas sp. 20V17]|uniref:Uncharacterized metal-binding protein YceD, DUF177 family n=1 Tax=Allgaiera indica TaxID=765699 RepID=A0AAN4ZYR9_9RHOB|nr:YceD family protein [Allgaiera indica]KDB03234.1 hypothetical protein U879_13065 [Defluviimonas sp. 20V17]GHE00649.1 hypothetical protein GCM10008024_13010 [Allgaiera indica]SDW58265.1 Uncharacterized metal-binding protein YceD, DUF177 family [Allgaiera indica]